MKALSDKRFHQIFLISLLILNLNYIYGQSVEKCCRFHKIPKSEYQFKLEEYKKELSDLISQKDTFLVSRSMNKIAESMYCLSYPLDSVYNYLEESYSWDKTAIFTRITHALESYPRIIAKQRKMNPDLTIADWKYDYREYYLFNLPDSISKPFMSEWANFRQVERLKKDTNFTITELSRIQNRDQAVRKEYRELRLMDSIKNIRLTEDISIRKDFIDLYNSQKNNFAKPLTESDKNAVFSVFTHAPSKFIEKHIEVINYLVEHNNNPNYNMILDRYFCNKYGETPLIGIYCKKNISLLKEFEEQFPKLYNHWRQTNL